MRMKAAFVIGLATGYVLGTRAGRARYEQIKQMAKSVSENPQVKHTADAVQAQAVHLGNQAKRAMQEKAGTIGHDMMEKMSQRLPSSMRFTHHTVDLDAATTRPDGVMT